MNITRRSLAGATAALLGLPLLLPGPCPRHASDLWRGHVPARPRKNDATYRPLAQHLASRLGRPVQLRTVDSWEGLAKSLANGETDIALMGLWGYVLANHFSDAQVVSTILYRGRPGDAGPAPGAPAERA